MATTIKVDKANALGLMIGSADTVKIDKGNALALMLGSPLNVKIDKSVAYAILDSDESHFDRKRPDQAWRFKS